MKKNLSLLILFVLAFSTSCLKKQNLDDDNLGPAFETTELSKALMNGYGALNYDIKPNEFTSYVLTFKYQDFSTSPQHQQDLTVEKVDNTSKYLNLDVIVTRTEFRGNNSFQDSPRSWPNQYFAKAPADENMLSVDDFSIKPLEAVEPTFLFFLYQYYAFNACHSTAASPASCHRLIVTDIDYPVPAGAYKEHGCDLSENNCTIKARKVEFDLLENNKLDQAGKPRRTHFTFVISAAVPYLSRMLQLCSRGLYDVDGTDQKLLADICYNINNYTFGTSQP